MTREVAIKAIQDFIGWFKEDSLIRKALDMAIKALSQEPCTDAVSREAVLQAVSEGCFELRGVYGRCEELINALPSVNPQPCDDAISRDAVYRLVDDIIDNLCENSLDLGALESWGREQVMNIPSVTQKSGKWIDIEDSNSSKCSECGAETPMYFDPYGHGKGIVVVETSYCPNCGARMESEDKE